MITGLGKIIFLEYYAVISHLHVVTWGRAIIVDQEDGDRHMTSDSYDGAQLSR
jgi:hypothetical protein